MGTGVLTENAELLGWDKTAGNQAKPEKVADPLRIFGIILIAFGKKNPNDLQLTSSCFVV